MRLAAVFCVWGVLGSATAWSQSPSDLLQGTLVRVEPQGIVLKTRNDKEVPVRFEPGATIEITGSGKLEDLPSGTSCRIHMGYLNTGTQEISIGKLNVPVAPALNQSPGTITLMVDGSVQFFGGVPGVLRNGPAPTFQVAGGSRYTVQSPTRNGSSIAPPQLQNSLTNRVVRLQPMKPGDAIVVDYEFGSDWRMAGVDARVVVSGTGNRQRIRVFRTEPLPAAKKK